MKAVSVLVLHKEGREVLRLQYIDGNVKVEWKYGIQPYKRMPYLLRNIAGHRKPLTAYKPLIKLNNMSCYVDTLIDYGWKLGPSCHLFADTEVELHAIAASIGMKRAWFQDGDKHAMPHYDLVASKRKLAIAKGAIEIDRNQLCEMLNQYRNFKKQATEGKQEGGGQ